MLSRSRSTHHDTLAPPCQPLIGGPCRTYSARARRTVGAPLARWVGSIRWGHSGPLAPPCQPSPFPFAGATVAPGPRGERPPPKHTRPPVSTNIRSESKRSRNGDQTVFGTSVRLRRRANICSLTRRNEVWYDHVTC